MAYYSGQASSYQELQSVLVNACTAQGWTWADGILSKGTVFIKPTVKTTTEQGHGLSIQGGTGKTGSTLTNPSNAQPRIGALCDGAPKVPAPIFPLEYSIFVFDTEVYFIIKYEIQRYMYLAFGGTGTNNPIWLAGSVSSGYMVNPSAQIKNDYGGVFIDPAGNRGTGYATPNQGVMSGFAWRVHWIYGITTQNFNYYINTSDYNGWLPRQTDASALCDASVAVQPLISRQPSAWSSNAQLLPIQFSAPRASSKYSIFTELKHTRFLRIDNYEPEQVITLGNEKWKILPFHKKNLLVRDGSTSNVGALDHTGTLGWAIRYDGP